MQASIQAGQTNGVVQQGRHRNAHRLDLREHVAVIGKPTAIKLLGGQLPPFRIRISDTHQIRIFEQAQHPGVMPAHVADANHTHLHRHHWIGHRQVKGGLG